MSLKAVFFVDMYIVTYYYFLFPHNSLLMRNAFEMCVFMCVVDAFVLLYVIVMFRDDLNILLLNVMNISFFFN